MTHNSEFTAFISKSFRILDAYMQCSPYAQARLRKIKPKLLVSLCSTIVHYCPFNLHPEKWFEGYPVKSTQFFSGWQKHLRFFRAWHPFFSDLYEIILRFACETNILMMAQSHYFHGLDNMYYRYLLVIYPVEQKSCVRCN